MADKNKSALTGAVTTACISSWNQSCEPFSTYSGARAVLEQARLTIRHELDVERQATFMNHFVPEPLVEHAVDRATVPVEFDTEALEYTAVEKLLERLAVADAAARMDAARGRGHGHQCR